MNTCIIIGRLTKDPEVRYTDGGMAIARFTLAVDRPSKDGEKQTDFPNCTAFSKTAENIEKYVSKGCKIAVQGSIQTGSYTNKDGRKIYTTNVVCQRVEFLDTKPKQDEQTTEEQPQQMSDAWTEITEDSIPF